MRGRRMAEPFAKPALQSHTVDQKYQPVIPRAVQRLLGGAPQLRDLASRTGARAAYKVPDQRRSIKDAAAHPGRRPGACVGWHNGSFALIDGITQTAPAGLATLSVFTDTTRGDRPDAGNHLAADLPCVMPAAPGVGNFRAGETLADGGDAGVG